MKHIKFTLLTICLFAISFVLMPMAGACGIIEYLCKVSRAEFMRQLFHFLTINIIDMNLQCFDVADSIMGHYTLDCLKPEIERKSFSVNFYNKEYKNLDSVVCEAHCRTCASHKAYSNKAAGYSFVEVEVI